MVGDPERILLTGDWHCDLQWGRSVISMLPELGVRQLIQVGDFGIWPGPSGELYLEGLEKALNRLDIQLWFLHGNHEHFPTLYSYGRGPGPVRITEHIHWLPTNTRWNWWGHHWVTIGGAASVDRSLRTPGLDWFAEEELTEAEVSDLINAGHADVVLCHDRPAQAPIALPPWPQSWAIADAARAEAHRERLGRAVDAIKPQLLVHGHLHLRDQRTVNFDHGPVEVLSLDKNAQPGNSVVVDAKTLSFSLLD